MDHRHSNPEHQARERDHSHARTNDEIRVEIETVEDLLRFDQDQTELPERIKERLVDSVPKHNVEQKPWWQRWFRPESKTEN